jgi:ectoine hydroxylase-related dioxygenase (phytanoyl-CoA dioxygenase family)
MIETAVNSVEEILRECGVTETSLSLREAESLDHDGYTVMTGVIDAAWLASLRAAFENGSPANDHKHIVKESGTRHIDDLVNKEAFDAVYTHPRVLAAVHHVLGCAFRLGQLHGRDPLPGYGQQGLHADWTARSKGEPYHIVTTIWMLDDFTESNGATRLVPGTHRLLSPPSKSFADPASRHSDQRIIVGAAGSVLVFNGHLWHSGTRNESSQSRRALQCAFVGKHEFRFPSLKIDDPDRLSAAARYILDA